MRKKRGRLEEMAGRGGLRTLVCALLVASVGASAALAAGTAQRAQGVILGVATNPATGAAPASGLDIARSAGAKGAFLSLPWSRLEPSPHRYNAADLRSLALHSRTRGLKLLVGLIAINTTAREVPRDLAGVAWDSPRMIARFRALVDALRPHLDANVTYVSLGNEVDMYLGKRPGEWASYGRFYADAVAYLHTVAPHVEVGVTTTYAGTVRKHVRKVAALNRPSDIEIVTYYPVAGKFSVRAPRSPRADFPKLVKAAGRRPVVFQEIGYPSSPRLGSSEAKQAQFVTHAFAAWRRLAKQVPFANFLLLHDLGASECGEIAAYYGRNGDTSLTDFLCSLGLRHSNGSPKAAWTSLVKGATSLDD